MVEIYRRFGENPDPTEEARLRGIAEIIYLRRRAEAIIAQDEKNSPRNFSLRRGKRTVPDSTYQNFLQEAGPLSSRISEQTGSKAALLAKYFPVRFGKKGRNEVDSMGSLGVGDLFNKMVNYSQRRLNQ